MVESITAGKRSPRSFGVVLLLLVFGSEVIGDTQRHELAAADGGQALTDLRFHACELQPRHRRPDDAGMAFLVVAEFVNFQR